MPALDKLSVHSFSITTQSRSLLAFRRLLGTIDVSNHSELATSLFDGSILGVYRSLSCIDSICEWIIELE